MVIRGDRQPRDSSASGPCRMGREFDAWLAILAVRPARCRKTRTRTPINNAITERAEAEGESEVAGQSGTLAAVPSAWNRPRSEYVASTAVGRRAARFQGELAHDLLGKGGYQETMVTTTARKSSARLCQFQQLAHPNASSQHFRRSGTQSLFTAVDGVRLFLIRAFSSDSNDGRI